MERAQEVQQLTDSCNMYGLFSAIKAFSILHHASQEHNWSHLEQKRNQYFLVRVEVLFNCNSVLECPGIHLTSNLAALPNWQEFDCHILTQNLRTGGIPTEGAEDLQTQIHNLTEHIWWQNSAFIFLSLHFYAQSHAFTYSHHLFWSASGLSHPHFNGFQDQHDVEHFFLAYVPISLPGVFPLFVDHLQNSWSNWMSPFGLLHSLDRFVVNNHHSVISYHLDFASSLTHFDIHPSQFAAHWSPKPNHIIVIKPVNKYSAISDCCIGSTLQSLTLSSRHILAHLDHHLNVSPRSPSQLGKFIEGFSLHHF